MLWALGCGLHCKCLGCYFGLGGCLEGLEAEGCCCLSRHSYILCEPGFLYIFGFLTGVYYDAFVGDRVFVSAISDNAFGYLYELEYSILL